MASLPRIGAAVSSTAVRILAYIFFRWVPGHPFPPAIYTFALTYYASLYSGRAAGKADESEENQKALVIGPKQGSNDKGAPIRENGLHYSPWKTWLLGLPAPGTRRNWLALSINAVLVLLTLDVIYTRPLLYPSSDLSFTRLGYISPVSASIFVREPDPAKVPLYLSYRVSSPPGTWRRADRIASLTDITDYTGTFALSRLEPDTQYEYTLSNSHHGNFTTAPYVGLVPDSPSAKGKFTFLTTSCIKSNFPYSPFSHRLKIPGLHHLASRLPDVGAQFMLFLGDFIYIDVPHFHSASVSNYRSEYRRVYASPSWPGVGSIPWLHLWDDHEIRNDWDKGSTPPYPAARDAFDHYHHAANPPRKGNATWYTLRAGPGSFFMLDTRSYRSPSASSPATDPAKTMLGPHQLRELLSWLREPEPKGVRWKFLISSIPFTRNWRVNAMDTWGGYLYERKRVLEAMWDVPLHSPGTGVVVLSGDRHEFAATRFPPPPPPPPSEGRETAAGDLGPVSVLENETEPLDAPKRKKGKADKGGKRAEVIEFSTSPLNMFYLPIHTYKSETPAEAGSIGREYGHDEMIKYIPNGNSKFGAVEMEETFDVTQPAVLKFRLFVNGEEVWTHELLSPAVSG